MNYRTLMILAAIVLAVGAGIVIGTRTTTAAPLPIGDGLTAEWGKGAWTIAATLANDALPAGTEIVLTATCTYYVDGDPVERSAEPASVTLTVREVQMRKEWVTDELVPLEIVEGSGSGPGGAEILGDGRLRWWVDATNDGAGPKTFSFRVRPKAL